MENKTQHGLGLFQQRLIYQIRLKTVIYYHGMKTKEIFHMVA